MYLYITISNWINITTTVLYELRYKFVCTTGGDFGLAPLWGGFGDILGFAPGLGTAGGTSILGLGLRAGLGLDAAEGGVGFGVDAANGGDVEESSSSDDAGILGELEFISVDEVDDDDGVEVSSFILSSVGGSSISK